MGQMTHLENRSSTAAWSGGRCHGDALGRRVEGVAAKHRDDDRNDQQRRITGTALAGSTAHATVAKLAHSQML
jgi:hypothetical protein